MKLNPVRRSIGSRLVALFLVPGMVLGGPIGQALAARPASSSAAGTAKRSTPRPVPATVRAPETHLAAGPAGQEAGFGLAVAAQPSAIRLTSASHAGQNPWVLFDGNPRTGLRSEDGTPVEIELELPAAQWIEGARVLGDDQGELTVRGAGVLPGLSGRALRGGGDWQRVEGDAPELTAQVTVTWEPSGTSSLNELRILARQPATKFVQDAVLADQLGLGQVPAGSVHRALPGHQRMASAPFGGAAAADIGRFEVDLNESLEGTARAFLVYELTGLTHWTGARRSSG